MLRFNHQSKMEPKYYALSWVLQGPAAQCQIRKLTENHTGGSRYSGKGWPMAVSILPGKINYVTRSWQASKYSTTELHLHLGLFGGLSYILHPAPPMDIFLLVKS